MSASLQRLSARIGRWPRRIAALLCLLLAAGTALVPHAPATAGASHGVGAQLRAGEVAVPVPIASGVGSVRPDDQVGVVAPPADSDTVSGAVLVADHLRVISLTQGSGLSGDANAVVTVAADRAQALQIARYVSRPLVMIVDDLP